MTDTERPLREQMQDAQSCPIAEALVNLDQIHLSESPLFRGRNFVPTFPRPIREVPRALQYSHTRISSIVRASSASSGYSGTAGRSANPLVPLGDLPISGALGFSIAAVRVRSISVT